MAYSLELDYQRVTSFIRDHPRLGREARITLFLTLHRLREEADLYRGDETRRLAPGSPYFWYHVPILDAGGSRRLFRFAVDDSAAASGVLRLVYADERPW